MGQPTFDLCYSEDEPGGAQAAGFSGVLQTAQRFGRPERAAELTRGACNRLRLRTEKRLFGLTEITKKVFITEYIGNKS